MANLRHTPQGGKSRRARSRRSSSSGVVPSRTKKKGETTPSTTRRSSVAQFFKRASIPIQTAPSPPQNQDENQRASTGSHNDGENLPLLGGNDQTSTEESGNRTTFSVTEVWLST